jgi:Tannase and feruloyl esterase
MEAQRYPRDFDGLISGAPAYDFTRFIRASRSAPRTTPTDGACGSRGVHDGLLADTNGQASSLQLAFGPEVFKYFVFGNPAWDYTTYDLANWARDTKAIASVLNADNPDLSGLESRRGRLIIWHGWADPALNAISTIKYYRRVEQRDPSARDNTRLYLLPGVVHCSGGPGSDRVDWLGALVDWVEHGKAPQRLISAKLGADHQPVRTRPACPHPQRAVYKGSGSTDDERNFGVGGRS